MDNNPNTIGTVAHVVSAYLENNRIPAGDLPSLIASVSASIVGLSQPRIAPEEKLTPPISVKRSITPEHIVSFEDGKRYKTLKRHLAGRNLTPEAYRAKWSLPADYPMVASAYSEKRSALAKSLGLGRKAKVAEQPAKRRGRPPKNPN